MLKSIIGLLAPSMVRAGTFFLDARWGEILRLFISSYVPFPQSLVGLFLVTAFFTAIFVGFEKWMKGDLQFYHFFGEKNRSAGDPNEGVFTGLNNRSVLF